VFFPAGMIHIVPPPYSPHSGAFAGDGALYFFLTGKLTLADFAASSVSDRIAFA
jgi:hypothetical protein